MIFFAETRLRDGKIEGRYRLARRDNPEVGAITGIRLTETPDEAEAWLATMAGDREITWGERVAQAAD